MSQMPMVGARVPHDWKDQIDAICHEANLTESDVVREAIAQYLGKTSAGSVQSMDKRIAALERQIKKLAALMIN